MEDTVIEKRILVIDVETDGLCGKPFAIGAKAYKTNMINNYICPVDFYACCSASVEDEWVRKNVLPDLEDTHDSIDAVLKEFAEFYLELKRRGYRVMWNTGHGDAIFRLMVEKEYIVEWTDDPLEVYVSTRISTNNNPLLDDCVQAMSAYAHLKGKEVFHSAVGVWNNVL